MKYTFVKIPFITYRTILFKVLALLRVMTKPGYTHVLISKSLHSVLKDKAEEHETSICQYIKNLMQTGNFKPGKLVGFGSPRRLFS